MTGSPSRPREVNWVTTDDGACLWTEAGGSGSGMVLLHGGPGLWDYLGPLASSLEDGLTVVRYDQRGAGRSDHVGPYTLERSVADCEAVREASGFEDLVVAGHSWGAGLALLYALSHQERVRGVLYIAGVGFDWPSWKAEFHREAVSRLSAQEAARLAALGTLDNLSPDEEAERTSLRWVTDYCDRRVGQERAAEMLAAGFAINYASNRELSHELEATGADAWYGRLSKLRCPVLVIQGAADPRPLAAVDGMVEALPTCRRVILEGGHFPWVEDSTTFYTTVRTWLRERAGVPH